MSDRFVTVASYTFTPEAQLAKNFLENEGIPAFLAGEMTAATLNGLGDEVHLQVHEKDARRAVSLLASVAAGTLDDDWETKAERGAGVWTCPLCGTPVKKGIKVCPDCQTPNEHITTDRRDTWPAGASRSPPEEAKKSEQVQAGAPKSSEEAAEEEAPKSGCAILFVLSALPALWWALS